MGRGTALQLRGHGRQGSRVSLYTWPHALVAQGQAERLSPGGSRLPPGVTVGQANTEEPRRCRSEPSLSCSEEPTVLARRTGPARPNASLPRFELHTRV